MTQQHARNAPSLLVLSRCSSQGRRINLAKAHVVVGRAQSCDVCIDEPHVSRMHASIRQHGDAFFVQDLGSAGGTFVNGVAVTEPRELRNSDVLAFAGVQLRYESGGPPEAETTVGLTPVRRDPGFPGRQTAPPVAYYVGQQRADAINNVGHNQYNSYVQHINQQRTSFLQNIAATKTKARWLVRIGFLFFVVGLGLFANGIIRFVRETGNAGSGGLSRSTTPFEPVVNGVPVGIVGWAMAAVGFLTLIVGIVLHVVATSRRKQVERDFPAQPSWHAPNM
jgi:pSer/pThr/pTyr-binding forkhead associated (FHA) protein